VRHSDFSVKLTPFPITHIQNVTSVAQLCICEMIGFNYSSRQLRNVGCLNQ